MKNVLTFFLCPCEVKFPISLRLNRPFNENLSWPESVEAEQLSSEVSENVSGVVC